jgi:hypothetical protein
MDTSKIIELLARKMAGEATTGELEQLNELISSYPDAVYSKRSGILLRVVALKNLILTRPICFIN